MVALGGKLRPTDARVHTFTAPLPSLFFFNRWIAKNKTHLLLTCNSTSRTLPMETHRKVHQDLYLMGRKEGRWGGRETIQVSIIMSGLNKLWYFLVMEYCTLLKNNEADLSVQTVERAPRYIIEWIKQSAEEHCAQCDFIWASKKWINLSADRCIKMLLEVYTRHG